MGDAKRPDGWYWVRYAGDPWEPRRSLGSWLDFAANAIETDPAEVGPRIEPPEVASPTERKPAHEAPEGVVLGVEGEA